MNRLGFVGRVALAVAAICLMAGVSGCGGTGEPAQPKPVGEAGAPPPPTPEELARRAIKDLELDQPLPAAGSRLPGSVRSSILTQFEQQQSNLSKTPEGQAALEIIKKKTEERVRALYSSQMWEHVIVYSDAYAKLDPQSKKFDEMRQKSEVELRKPRVTVRGLPQKDGMQFAMLSIYIPMTSQTYTEDLRVGEEMHGIKFLEVFGDNKGVRLEYLETGERFVVLLPSAK